MIGISLLTRLWSYQEVLYFGNTTPNNANPGHCTGNEVELNSIECSKEDLIENSKSMRISQRRKVPDDF